MSKQQGTSIEASKITEQPIFVLKQIYKEGKKHLEYFASTQSVFKFPEKRVKCYDTTYYEQVMPVIVEILREYENSK